MQAWLPALSLCSLLLVACAGRPLSPDPPVVAREPEVLSWSDVTAQAKPAPGLLVTYGSDPLQFGELRLPEGDGPFPVVVLIHGGCWRSSFNLEHLAPLAVALRFNGFAVWTLEYRRLGDAGGGWPGTFRDVGQGVDRLRALATEFPLDLERVIAVGHSAGGQLALWLPSRAALAPDSELFQPDPLPLSGVLGLAPITDLARYREGPEDSCHAAVDPLLGGSPDAVPQRYAETSPLDRVPLGVPVWLVQGSLDEIVPAEGVRHFAAAAREAGDTVTLGEIDTAGHFEPVVPNSSTWPLVLAAVRELAGVDE